LRLCSSARRKDKAEILLRTLCLAGVVGLVASVAYAEDYPSRPVRIVHGYASGGAIDNVARILGEALRKELGQPIVVESRPGASGTIAAVVVAKSDPDGYTLLLGGNGSQTINVQLIRPWPFDPLKDFTPISQVVINDSVLVASPSFPANNFRELVDLAKKDPGKYLFGSGGVGGPTHLGGELLMARAKIDVKHVPYRGDAPAIIDLMGGFVPLAILSMASAAQSIKDGKIKAIAALGDQRFPEFPDLATIAEQGYPGLSVSAWVALYGPANLSSAITSKLNSAVRRVLSDQDIVKKLEAIGGRAKSSSPSELSELVKSEYDKWGAVIRENNISLQ
jgi:tripartite-type tricarboxylate transporter receptor subunit TctC